MRIIVDGLGAYSIHFPRRLSTEVVYNYVFEIGNALERVRVDGASELIVFATLKQKNSLV